MLAVKASESDEEPGEQTQYRGERGDKKEEQFGAGHAVPFDR